jgi:pantoate--beta-alanine ligase
MDLFKHSKDLKRYLKRNQLLNTPLGFVPTMGALHEGHLSLLKESKKICKTTICSIFVNPTQFNNEEDFLKYPKTLSNDILLLEENGCDILFLPSEAEIYPDEQSKQKHFELGYIETILEGKFRPGHFQGVCNVVEKLLNIVDPDFLFLGQKDFQQCMVIKKLLDLIKSKTQLIICPIVREKNGLAKSSRNLRLNDSEKQIAANLYKSLSSVKKDLTPENFPELKEKAVSDLEKNGFKVEYLELAKTKNLESTSDFLPQEDIIILIAAFLNDIRLIDNLLINP